MAALTAALEPVIHLASVNPAWRLASSAEVELFSSSTREVVEVVEAVEVLGVV